MLKQTQTKYKSIMLGNGSGSLYDFGCYLFSLVQGLIDKGYVFTPEGFNEVLKSKGLWVGPFQNYIDVDNIAKKYPEIFKSYTRVDTWPSNDQLNTWIQGNFVVVCQVNAAGIGGSGTHFVLLKRMDGNTAIIGDPWFGTEDKVTLHYGKLGNILSLRVFEVKLLSTELPMPDELQEILTHYKVKSADEFIASNDQQLQFLADERSKTAGLESTVKELTTKHNSFVQKLLGLINSFGNPLGLTDDELVVKTVTELVSSTSELQGKLASQEKAAAKVEQSLKAENETLQKKLSKLQEQLDSLKSKYDSDIESMQKRIDSVQDSVDTHTTKQDDFSTFKSLFNPIINYFKGLYGKTK